MLDQLTLADIVRNALDDVYSVEQAAIDLGKLMCEMELIKRRFGTGSHIVSLNWKGLFLYRKSSRCESHRETNYFRNSIG
jgi:hypothetical protein